MARLAGVPHFFSDDSTQHLKEYLSMARRARKLDDDGLSLRKSQIEAVRGMQKRFDGYLLRRTSDSTNWEGRTLLDLPPHKDITGVLELTDRETSIIQERAEAAKAT
jgi:hypothetical protein